jgi:hypothetical protein
VEVDILSAIYGWVSNVDDRDVFFAHRGRDFERSLRPADVRKRMLLLGSNEPRE